MLPIARTRDSDVDRTTTIRSLDHEALARARRARSLARLAERRRVEDERRLRAEAMARHPAGRARRGVVAPALAVAEPELRLVRPAG